MAIVSLYNYIVAVKTVMRYCNIIKGYSERITNALKRKNFNEIQDIQPYIEGILWSQDKLNIQHLDQFNQLVEKHFGSNTHRHLRNFNMVDGDLRNCINSRDPKKSEMQGYLDKFLKRYNLKLQDYSCGQSYLFQDNPTDYVEQNIEDT